MDISKIASIVTIVGGIIGILNTVMSKDGFFTRLFKRKPASLSKPTSQIPTRLRGFVVLTTIFFGVFTGIAAILVSFGGTFAFAIIGPGLSAFLQVFATVILYVIAGLLPTRLNGKLVSGVLASVILSAFFASGDLPFFISQEQPLFETIGSVLADFVGFSVVGGVIALISSVAGVGLYRTKNEDAH